MTAINVSGGEGGGGGGSVHFTDTEAVSRRTFICPRYEVPLFLCKRLGVPVERKDDLELKLLRNGHRNLLQGMTNYGQLPNWKAGITVNLCPGWKAPKRTPASILLPHSLSPPCPKSLRNGHKEWTLPPNRYRLGGNISDSASRSTGRKGPYQCFTGERFPAKVVAPAAAAAGANSGSLGGRGWPGEVYYEQIPREMDKLAQPRRYFVGKIRPGDKGTERPCSRLALSTATLCWRNPAEPGPDRYFKGIFDIAPKVVVATTTTGGGTSSELQTTTSTTANRHGYCAEPFRRPPPGRYDLCRGLPPSMPQRRRRQRPRPLEMTLNANWKPFRQPATLRMHTVDIPKRRRKRGRNMKVAFGSSTARFKDQEFFPIGALQSALPASGHQQRRRSHTRTSQSAALASACNIVDYGDEVEPSRVPLEVEPACSTTSTQQQGLSRTKMFIVPRRRQTVANLARLWQVPPSTSLEEQVKQGARMVSWVKIEPPNEEQEGDPPAAEVFDDGGGDDRAAVVDKKAVKTEMNDEKLNSNT